VRDERELPLANTAIRLIHIYLSRIRDNPVRGFSNTSTYCARRVFLQTLYIDR